MKNKNIFYIILGVFVVVVLTSLFINGLFKNNSQIKIIDSLNSEINSLNLNNANSNNQLIKCYSDIKNNTPECYDPSQCIKNPNLAGCYKDSEDCNWCCFSVCTLMRCVYEK